MILGLIEHDQGTLNKASLEMLTLGRTIAEKLSAPLEAIIVGTVGSALADQIKLYGVSKIYVVQNDRLNDYAPEAWAKSVVQHAETAQPEAILAAGTDRGNELMAHIAARTNSPLATNCTTVEPGETYAVTRVRWGGSLLEEARLSGVPKLLTSAPHVIMAEEANAPGDGVIETVIPDLTDKDFRVRISKRVDTSGDKVSLVDARVVVSGGRGVGSEEGFKALEDLAHLVGGAVGCSRAVTNNGWRPHADQVGQTGTRVAPDIYIACGISGAIQHVVGCKGSKYILVINTDPEAPILAKADYAVIGDLHEVLPAIGEEIKKLG
ncbi:MAG: electron transfer flavoprotein subunit alpha/FixB family protein [Chloroflexota bacterium]